MELLNKREKEEQKESKKDILYELYYIFKNQNQHFQKHLATILAFKFIDILLYI